MNKIILSLVIIGLVIVNVNGQCQPGTITTITAGADTWASASQPINTNQAACDGLLLIAGDKDLLWVGLGAAGGQTTNIPFNYFFTQLKYTKTQLNAVTNGAFSMKAGVGVYIQGLTSSDTLKMQCQASVTDCKLQIVQMAASSSTAPPTVDQISTSVLNRLIGRGL